jgi:hypothetical protein
MSEACGGSSSCNETNIIKNYVISTGGGGLSGDTYVSAATFTNNVLTLELTEGAPDVTTTIDSFSAITISGLTIDGDLNICSSGATLYVDNIDPCLTAVTINDSIIVIPDGIVPTTGDTKSIGTPTRRFRDVNTISGTSTVWTSTDRVITPNLDLGLDSQSNSRIITADNSIIQDDTLYGGTF